MSNILRIISALECIILSAERIGEIARDLPANTVDTTEAILNECAGIGIQAASCAEILNRASSHAQQGVAIIPHPLDPSSYAIFLANISRIIGKYPTETDAQRAADLNGFHVI